MALEQPSLDNLIEREEEDYQQRRNARLITFAFD